MRDPARIVSGTSMPNYFAAAPSQAEGGAMVEALWASLALGARGLVPEGFVLIPGATANENRPEPAKDAIVVRADLPDATPAAIAVGLPGKLSFCFDAAESRLRYAWRGGFVDLGPTLLKKTDDHKLTPTAALVGDVFYRSEAFPLRLGSPDRMPAVRFRGYRLVAGLPEFRYEVDGVDVRETIRPSDAPPGLKREIVIARVDGAAWLLDARFPGDRLEIPRGAPARVEAIIKAERAR
jgi:hypothetical protein